MKILPGEAYFFYDAGIQSAQAKLRCSGNDSGYGNPGHAKLWKTQEAKDKYSIQDHIGRQRYRTDGRASADLLDGFEDTQVNL